MIIHKNHSQLHSNDELSNKLKQFRVVQYQLNFIHNFQEILSQHSRVLKIHRPTGFASLLVQVIIPVCITACWFKWTSRSASLLVQVNIPVCITVGLSEHPGLHHCWFKWSSRSASLHVGFKWSSRSASLLVQVIIPVCITACWF